MLHILSVVVENNPGVLMRVASLIRRRGFNIESVAVGPNEDPRTSRMTLVVEGDEAVLEQINKQLQKLVEVLKVQDLARERSVSRELALIKVHADPGRRSQILQLAQVFRANVVDVGRKTMMLEVTGDSEKVEALLSLAREFGIQEVARTGAIALERGAQVVRWEKEEETRDADVLRL